MSRDMINHPAHYERANEHPSGVECIEIVRHMPHSLGCAIKYLYRAGHKGSAAEDYRKAAWYLRDYADHCHVKDYVPTSRSNEAMSRWCEKEECDDLKLVLFHICKSFVSYDFYARFFLRKAATGCLELEVQAAKDNGL
jgi:hypothetical protein